MVMHARKPQRMSDGFFEKHQAHPYQSSKYTSKREYERETTSRSSNYRDRGDSPSSSGGLGGSSGNGGSASMNNGSYRSQSRELDSPPRHEFRDRERGDRPSYLQKMRDRDRDVYKKDKYSDKRDRRGNDRESEHRTNHDRLDRRSKICSSDKRSGSDDRERERDRDLRDSKRDRGGGDRDRSDRDRNDRDRDRDRSDRDRDRDRERNERGSDRITRIGDWSEHVSSSGKMYYYNCKTEVSQWEKPKEWLEKERSLAKDQHREREYREKERERDREDRFSRSSAVAYTKHSSSRDSSRLRWPYENDVGHRRRHEDNPDMDISPGDSTPTSEASYSLSGTPTAQLNDIAVTGVLPASSMQQQPQQPVLLANALPRVASHPPIASNSQMHFTQTQQSVVNVGSSANNNSCNSNNTSGQANNNSHRSKLDSLMQQSNLSSVSSPNNSGANTANHLLHHQHNLHHSQQQQQQQSTIVVGGSGSEHHLSSNTPGPPQSKLAGLTTTTVSGIKSLDQVDMNPQKVLLRQTQQPQSHHGILSSMQVPGQDTQVLNSVDTNSSANVVNLRDNPLNSPLYNLTHGMSPLNHNKNSLGVVSGNCNTQGNNNVAGQYTCNAPFGLKTVDGVGAAAGSTIGISGTALGSIPSLTNVGTDINSGSVSGGGGPPTPTQELDISANSSEQRKLEGTSASLSSLQSCVNSSAAGRSQGPEISPKLAKYFRPDLITHVTNWPAEMLEKQAQECSKETHIYGDLQCTKVSAELKCARSLVRITEITATLQEQKIMYLRQQIRRLEELKSQNSFMSDDL